VGEDGEERRKSVSEDDEDGDERGDEQEVDDDLRDSEEDGTIEGEDDYEDVERGELEDEGGEEDEEEEGGEEEEEEEAEDEEEEGEKEEEQEEERVNEGKDEGEEDLGRDSGVEGRKGGDSKRKGERKGRGMSAQVKNNRYYRREDYVDHDPGSSNGISVAVGTGNETSIPTRSGAGTFYEDIGLAVSKGAPLVVNPVSSKAPSQGPRSRGGSTSTHSSAQKR